MSRSYIRIIITALLIILAVYVNIIALRRISHYALEVYFYDKLSVAYDIGGRKGLEKEIARIKTTEKQRLVAKMAEELEGKISLIPDPAPFIDNSLSAGKNRIRALRSLRIIAILLIMGILLLRFLVNRKPGK